MESKDKIRQKMEAIQCEIVEAELSVAKARLELSLSEDFVEEARCDLSNVEEELDEAQESLRNLLGQWGHLLDAHNG
tara:strand:+ start:388 stop:618 length:231 start_codon:yes stop_codon:yes gene_type:complete